MGFSYGEILCILLKKITHDIEFNLLIYSYESGTQISKKRNTKAHDSVWPAARVSSLSRLLVTCWVLPQDKKWSTVYSPNTPQCIPADETLTSLITRTLFLGRTRRVCFVACVHMCKCMRVRTSTLCSLSVVFSPTQLFSLYRPTSSPSPSTTSLSV